MDFTMKKILTDVRLFLHKGGRAKGYKLGPLARAGLYKLSHSFLKNLNLAERCVDSELDFDVDARIW